MRVNSDPDGMSVRSPRVSTVPVSSWIRKGRVAEESRKYTTWGKRGTCLITRVLQKLVHINYWQDSPPIHYNYYVQKDEILGMCTCSNTVRVCGRGCARVLCVGGVCGWVYCVWAGCACVLCVCGCLTFPVDGPISLSCASTVSTDVPVAAVLLTSVVCVWACEGVCCMFGKG